MICPHCKKGKLKPQGKVKCLQLSGKTMNICSVCGRGWTQDDKGNWQSHFATDKELYSSDGRKLLDCATWHFHDKDWDGKMNPLAYKKR